MPCPLAIPMVNFVQLIKSSMLLKAALPPLWCPLQDLSVRSEEITKNLYRDVGMVQQVQPHDNFKHK